jgi:hypothetical protein
MARGPSTFRQSDITKAVKAVVAAGVEVARVEVDREGRIIVVAEKPAGAQTVAEENEWDQVGDQDQARIRAGVR